MEESANYGMLRMKQIAESLPGWWTYIFFYVVCFGFLSQLNAVNKTLTRIAICLEIKKR